jgi:hypothetical protein
MEKIRIRNKHHGLYFQELRNKFLLQIRILYPLPFDPGSGMDKFGSGMGKFGSRDKIPDPQHCPVLSQNKGSVVGRGGDIIKELFHHS